MFLSLRPLNSQGSASSLALYYFKLLMFYILHVFCFFLVAQSCPTLCDPEDCSLPDSSVHGDSSGKSTRVGCDALLQGIFPTQGSNPGPPHCMRILYRFSHQGSPNHFIVILNSVFYLCRAEAPQMVDVLLGCL